MNAPVQWISGQNCRCEVGRNVENRDSMASSKENDEAAFRARLLAEHFADLAKVLADPSRHRLNALPEALPEAMEMHRRTIDAHWALLLGVGANSERDSDAKVRAKLFELCSVCAARVGTEGYDVERATRNTISMMDAFTDSDTHERLRLNSDVVLRLIVAIAKQPGRTTVKAAAEALFLSMGWAMTYEDFRAALRMNKKRRKA